MQRRNFIKQAVIAAGALSLPSIGGEAFSKTPASVSGASAPASGFKKSIMWGTIGLEGTVADKCQAVKAAGFDGIEPNSHMDRNEVIAAMKANGLVASSVCCSTHWAAPLSSPDAVVRQEGIDGMIVALEDAKAYGTDAVLFVPGVVSESVAYDECWNRSVEGIKKLLPTAEKLKVKICIENVWNNFLLSPTDAVRYVDQFNSPYVKFYFDCGNILYYGWPEQWIRILGNRIGRVHIKEFSKQIAEKGPRWEGFNVKLTDGDVNWVKVMEEIRTNYRSGWLTTEQGSSDTLEELKDLSERFDKILTNYPY